MPSGTPCFSRRAPSRARRVGAPRLSAGKLNVHAAAARSVAEYSSGHCAHCEKGLFPGRSAAPAIARPVTFRPSATTRTARRRASANRLGRSTMRAECRRFGPTTLTSTPSIRYPRSARAESVSRSAGSVGGLAAPHLEIEPQSLVFDRHADGDGAQVLRVAAGYAAPWPRGSWSTAKTGASGRPVCAVKRAGSLVTRSAICWATAPPAKLVLMRASERAIEAAPSPTGGRRVQERLAVPSWARNRAARRVPNCPSAAGMTAFPGSAGCASPLGFRAAFCLKPPEHPRRMPIVSTPARSGLPSPTRRAAHSTPASTTGARCVSRRTTVSVTGVGVLCLVACRLLGSNGGLREVGENDAPRETALRLLLSRHRGLHRRRLGFGRLPLATRPAMAAAHGAGQRRVSLNSASAPARRCQWGVGGSRTAGGSCLRDGVRAHRLSPLRHCFSASRGPRLMSAAFG